MVPDNVVAAAFMQEYTTLKPIDSTNLSMGYQKVTDKSFKTNILGLCVFSLILGFALIELGQIELGQIELDQQVNHFKLLLEQINATVMKIMSSFVK